MSESHLITRAKQRYNLDLTIQDVQRMEWYIVMGYSTLVEKHGDREYHDLVYNKVLLRCVFARSTERIVTFLSLYDTHHNARY